MQLEKGLQGGAAGPSQRAGHPDRECPTCHRTAPASRGALRGSRHALDTASGEARVQLLVLRHDALSGGAEASVGKITEILERRTSQHGWCDTEAIGFLPQAVGPEQRSVQALTVRLRSKVSVVPDVRTRLRSTTSASPGSARRHLAPRRVMRRHHRAAIRFLRTWLKKQGGLPRRLITDQRRSSPAAHRTVTPSVPAPHAAVGDQPCGGVPSTNVAAGAPQMQRFKIGLSCNMAPRPPAWSRTCSTSGAICGERRIPACSSPGHSPHGTRRRVPADRERRLTPPG